MNGDAVKTLCGGYSCETLTLKSSADMGDRLGIVFTLDGTYFISENYIRLFIYVPPDGLNWYSDETNGIEILRNTQMDIKIMYSNHKLLIAGDMNARIGNELDYIIDDKVFIKCTLVLCMKFVNSQEIKR